MGEEGDKAKVFKLAVNRKIKFRNTHWLKNVLQPCTINHGNYFVKLN